MNDHVAIHPIAEWQLDIPVNRQDFDCPVVTTSTGGRLGGTDSCLADEGIAAWHQHVTLGARVYPLAGLSILAGIDLGRRWLRRCSCRSSRPTRPIASCSALPTRGSRAPPPGDSRDREAGRGAGRQADGTDPRHGARPGRAGVWSRTRRSRSRIGSSTRCLARADGTFDTYSFEPGDVHLALEAEGYEPASCSGAIPVAGGDVTVSCTMHALPSSAA